MHWAIFIQTFPFVVKYFALITASWTLLCCPIIGNHSNIRKYRFHARYAAKKFSQNTFLVSKYTFKVAANQRYILWKWKKSPKNFWADCWYFYIHLTLFRMRKRASEWKFNTILQVAIEYVYTQVQESTKWTGKVSNISKYLSSATKPGTSS